jgi:hypothetical protein
MGGLRNWQILQMMSIVLMLTNSMGGSEKVPKSADVIYGWSLIAQQQSEDESSASEDQVGVRRRSNCQTNIGHIGID